MSIFRAGPNYDATPAATYDSFLYDGVNQAISQLDAGLFGNFYAAKNQGEVFTLAPNWGTWGFGDGVVGIAYDQEWDMPDCASPMTYSVLSGSLPGGLSLTTIANNEAKISGTPTTAGTFSFTLRAVNSIGTSDQAFSITINAASSGGGEHSYTFCS